MTEPESSRPGHTSERRLDERRQAPSVFPRMTVRRWLLLSTALASVTVLVAAREVLLPLVLALVVAYVFMPGVRNLERRGMQRYQAILAIYLVTIGAISTLGVLAYPRFRHETQQIAREIPKTVRLLEEEVLPQLQARFTSATAGEHVHLHEVAPAGPTSAAPLPSASAASAASAGSPK